MERDGCKDDRKPLGCNEDLTGSGIEFVEASPETRSDDAKLFTAQSCTSKLVLDPSAEKQVALFTH